MKIKSNKGRFIYACAMMPIAIGWMFIAYFWWRWMIWRCETIDLGDLDNCAD